MRDRRLPAVVFFTGLSGAGKTTIAKAVQARLSETGHIPVLLDGDDIRAALQLTGFDEAARRQHNLATGRLAALFESQGHTVLVSLIAPYRDARQTIREGCKRFIEVYVSTPLETCIARDAKGLYAKALRGELPGFTGIEAPYEPPLQPELTLDTTTLTLEECVASVIHLLMDAHD